MPEAAPTDGGGATGNGTWLSWRILAHALGAELQAEPVSDATTTRIRPAHESTRATRAGAQSSHRARRRSAALVSEIGLEPGEDPVPGRCVVNMDSVESVSVAILVGRLGRLADTRMRQICRALAVAVDCADCGGLREDPARKPRPTVDMPSAIDPSDRPVSVSDNRDSLMRVDVSGDGDPRIRPAADGATGRSLRRRFSR